MDNTTIMTDNDEQLASLVSMGFDSSRAEEALEASGGNIDEALGYLLSGKATEKSGGASKVKSDTPMKQHHGTSLIQQHAKDARSSSQSLRQQQHNVPWSNPNEQRTLPTYQQQTGDQKKAQDSHQVNCPTVASDALAAGLAATSAVAPYGARPLTTETTDQPGAEAIVGPGSLRPPVQPEARPREDATYLASARLVEGDEQEHLDPGPLVLASPMEEDDRVSRRDMRRYCITGGIMVLLVLVGIVVAVVLLLNDQGLSPEEPNAAVGNPNVPTFAPAVSPPTGNAQEPSTSSTPPSTTTALPTSASTAVNDPVPTASPTRISTPAPTAPPPTASPTTPPPVSVPTPLPATPPPTPLPTPKPTTPSPTPPPTPVPTEPPTSPPTPPPYTPVPTDPPTKPPTSPPTLPPTQVPTEPPTVPPSEPPLLHQCTEIAVDGDFCEYRATFVELQSSSDCRDDYELLKTDEGRFRITRIDCLDGSTRTKNIWVSEEGLVTLSTWPDVDVLCDELMRDRYLLVNGTEASGTIWYNDGCTRFGTCLIGYMLENKIPYDP